jgi:SAM-dependent methyltransferase
MVPLFCPGCRCWHGDPIHDRAGNPRGCPECFSLERHRLLTVLLPVLACLPAPDGPTPENQATPGLRVVVDVAPSRALDPVLDRLPDSRRLRMDFDPAADDRQVDVRASVTAIPLPDRSVDLLICSHVLEHVPDDTLAMREIARVLSDEGLGVVMVPQRAGPTEEDPDAPPDERARRFGQADHVRYYGDDVDERLAAAGLTVSRLRCDDLVTPSLVRILRLFPWEPVWLVRPARSPLPLPTATQLRERLPDVLGDAVDRMGVTAAGLRTARDELHRAERESRHWQRAARQWETRYLRLRTHPAVRVMLALRRGTGHTLLPAIRRPPRQGTRHR